MLKTSIVTLVVSCLMSFNAYAGQVITLSPKESRSITNHSLWTVNATCHVQGKQGSGRVLVSVMENKCVVNGKNLSKGQATSIMVKKDGHLSVSAEPGTKVNLVNLSTASVQAICS